MNGQHNKKEGILFRHLSVLICIELKTSDKRIKILNASSFLKDFFIETRTEWRAIVSQYLCHLCRAKFYLCQVTNLYFLIGDLRIALL